jgi:SAM-dependent methyltransferase
MQVLAVAEHLTDHAGQVRGLFDAKAATWPAKYAHDGRLSGRLTRLAAALSNHVPAAGRVLDLGCGTGELARAAAARGMLVTACDISQQMLRRAAERDPIGAVEWVQLCPNWQTLPFEPFTFDAVVASSVLEYVDDPAAVLSECARVLRTRGVVLCTVPDLSHPIRWLECLAGLAARLPWVRAASDRWPRCQRYFTYLRISRHRTLARWWRATGERAGLHLVPCPSDLDKRAPLRLLAFRGPGDAKAKPS